MYNILTHVLPVKHCLISMALSVLLFVAQRAKLLKFYVVGVPANVVFTALAGPLIKL